MLLNQSSNLLYIKEKKNTVQLGGSAEVSLDPVHVLAVDLERYLEHLVWDRRLRPERREGHELRAGALAVEPRQHHGGSRHVHVVQEVHHPAREHERLPGAQQLRVQPVRRVREPHQHASRQHQRHLRRARVRVRRRQPARRQVGARHGETLRVRAGERRRGARHRHVEPEQGRRGGGRPVLRRRGRRQRRGGEVLCPS